MKWTVTTPPTVEPLHYKQCKSQARLDGDSERDWIEQVAIPAVRATAEKEAQVSLITRTITLILYPDHDVRFARARLPQGPVQSITSVKDGNGATVDPLTYSIVRHGYTDYLSMQSMPTAFPITVVYKAGFADAPEGIPADLRAVMLAHFTWMYENRSANSEPTALDRFFRQYRSFAG